MARSNPDFREIPPAKGLAAEFLAGVAEGRLKLQRCRSCANCWHYPRPLCPDCAAGEFEWIESEGRGTIHSFTIVHRAPRKALKDRTPYVIAMIDLEEGARLLSLLAGDDPLGAGVGDRVRIDFPRDADGQPGMPVFRRVPGR